VVIVRLQDGVDLLRADWKPVGQPPQAWTLRFMAWTLRQRAALVWSW